MRTVQSDVRRLAERCGARVMSVRNPKSYGPTLATVRIPDGHGGWIKHSKLSWSAAKRLLQEYIREREKS